MLQPSSLKYKWRDSTTRHMPTFDYNYTNTDSVLGFFLFSRLQTFLTNILKNSKDLEQCWKFSNEYVHSPAQKTSVKIAWQQWIIQFFLFFSLLKPFYTEWCSAERLMQVTATWPDQSQVFTVMLAELCPSTLFSNAPDILFLGFFYQQVCLCWPMNSQIERWKNTLYIY